jgi:hypothetical protein
MLESQAGFTERANEQEFIRTLSGCENWFVQGAEEAIKQRTSWPIPAIISDTTVRMK